MKIFIRALILAKILLSLIAYNCIADNLPQRMLVITSSCKSRENIIIDQTFRQLGVFWKIPVDIKNNDKLVIDDIYNEKGNPKYCIVILSAIVSGDIHYAPSIKWDLIKKINNNIPIITFYKAANIQSECIEDIWGVRGVNRIEGVDRLIIYLNNNDIYTKDLPNRINEMNKENIYFGNLTVTEAIKIAYTNNEVLITKKNKNVYFAIDPRQFGIISFTPFFKIMENIIFSETHQPHFAMGGYGSLRIDDYPATTENVAIKWDKHSKTYYKRLVSGFISISPIICVIEAMMIFIVLFNIFYKKIVKLRKSLIIIALLIAIVLILLQYYLINIKYQNISVLSIPDKLFFIGYDIQREKEVRRIQKASLLYGVKTEYMVTSHILFPDGQIYSQDSLFPITTQKMVELYRGGKININTHGRTHINESKYLKSKILDSLEYIGLNSSETQAHLEDTVMMLKNVFGKTPTGFVAPAWGYQDGVTKEIAGNYFDYIVDKNSFYLRSEKAYPFGVNDFSLNYINAPETWEYGMKGIDEADQNTWNSYLSVGMPIHFMMHGPDCDSQEGDILKICKAGYESGVRWLFLEELVHFANEYSEIEVSNRNLGSNIVLFNIFCKDTISQEFLLISDKEFNSITLDGRRIDFRNKRKLWIPKLNKGRHEIIITYNEKEKENK